MKNRLKLIFSSENKKNLVILSALILALIVSAVFLIRQAGNSIPLPEGCRPGDKFSQTTGRQCKDGVLTPCLEEDVFDRNTGKPCPETGGKPIPLDAVPD